MADVVAKLKVDSKEYESKIKRASQGLMSLEDSLKKAGQSFVTADKDAVAFAQELGKMDTVSRNAKGRVGELSNAFVDLSATYKRMTDEEKASPFGQAMAASLEQLKQRTIDAKQELASLEGQLRTVGDAKMDGGQMGALSGVFGSGGRLGSIASALGASQTALLGIGASVAAAGAAFKVASDNIATALNFEKSMSMLSSLTGKTGQELEKLKEYAIELGSTTTLTASQVADAFRLIGSQQPQLLSSGEALKEVTKYAIRLSEAAGIDLSTASQTLSTSINQMGGDSNNAARYVNVLAAASQKGAGDIAWLGEAITKSATAAKAVGTDYEELVANLEQLAKAGFDASTAGTALRSIIMNLEKQANDEFKPSIVGLTEAFQHLSEAHLTISEYQGIVGKMFATQAMALADAADEARNMTDAITGTNIAEEQARTNTDNLDGSLKALASAWEGLNLHINDSNGFLSSSVDWLKEVVKWADQTFTAAGRAQKALEDMQGGGDGKPTLVDNAIQRLQQSSTKESDYQGMMRGFDDWIRIRQEALQSIVKNAASINSVLPELSKQTGTKYTSVDQLRLDIRAIKTMRDTYVSRARSILEGATENVVNDVTQNGTIDLSVDVDIEDGEKSIKQLQEEVKRLKKLRDEAANAGNTQLRDTYNEQIKQAQNEIKLMRGSSTPTKSKPQMATERYENAQRVYEQALEQAALEVKAGTLSAADAKKKELQAQEQLWRSIGDARHVYDSERLKVAQDAAAKRIVELGGEVNALSEAQKKAQESAKELERAQKKLADAEARMAEAQVTNDLGARIKAQEAVKAAQAEMERVMTAQGEVSRTKPASTLTGASVEQVVDVVPGRVDLPDVAETVTQRVNVVPGRVEVPAVPDVVEQVINTKVGEVMTPEIAGEVVQTISTRLGDIVTPDIKDELTQVINTKVGEVVTPWVADSITQVINTKVGEVVTPWVPETVTQRVNVVPGRVDVPEVPKVVRQVVDRRVDQVVHITYTEANMGALLSRLKGEIARADLGSALYDELTSQLADVNALANLMQTAVKSGIDTAQFDPQELWGKVFGETPGDYVPDGVWQGILDKINAERSLAGETPISIDFKTGGVSSAKQLSKEGDNIAHSFQQAASAVGSLGSAIQSIEDPGARVAGIIANAIATVAQTFAKSLAGTFTPWDWIAGAAAGTATMFSTIAAIKSATAGSYAEGGIVPGNNYNDGLIANVSSGELILNRSQQSVIAGQLMGADASRSVGRSDVTISSENIRIILHNAARSRGMSVGEYLEL